MEEVITRADELIREHALQTCDAVRLATVLTLRDETREFATSRRKEPTEEAPRERNEPRVLLMAYDRSLTEAARQEDFAYERESPPPPGTDR
jgi:hypothetical protein